MRPLPSLSTRFPYTTLFRSYLQSELSRAYPGAMATGENLFSHQDARNLILARGHRRSEEHTSELQSRGHLVCRLLHEKHKCPKKQNNASSQTRSHTITSGHN